jgi:hypothetical protein
VAMRVSVAAMVVLWAVQLYLNSKLVHAEAPAGIVSLELACTAEKAGCILDAWAKKDPGLRATARLGVWWDFPLILAYVATLALGCIESGKVLKNSWGWPGFARAGWFFVGLALIAGACDVFEDLGLLKQLGAGADAAWALRTCRASTTKFILILFCAAFWFARPLGAMIRYAATHVALFAVLGLVYGFVFGLVGTGNGIPSLFWNDDPWQRFFASLGVTLLLLDLGVIVYYEQRDEPGGLVEVMAGPPPWSFLPSTSPGIRISATSASSC